MIRGRKEGSNYATWFIGFDHELPPPPAPTSGRQTPSGRQTVTLSGPTVSGRQTPASAEVAALTLGRRTPAEPIATQTVSVEASTTEAGTDAERPKTTEAFTVTDCKQTVDSATGTTDLETLTRDSYPFASTPINTVDTGISTDDEVRENTSNRNSFKRINHFQNTHSNASSPVSIGRGFEDSAATTVTVTNEKLQNGNDSYTTSSPGGGFSSSTTDGENRKTPTLSSPTHGSKKGYSYLDRARKKRERDTKGLYREALDGARRAEEFKFRVRFDNLLSDLYLSLQDRKHGGLGASFTSTVYGELMITFRERVKDLLQDHTDRLLLAYDSFHQNTESIEDNSNQVRQRVTDFVEELIGESLGRAWEETSEFSSGSADSAAEQDFVELLSQAVISKLLENHRKQISDALIHNGYSSDTNLNRNYNLSQPRSWGFNQRPDIPPGPGWRNNYGGSLTNLGNNNYYGGSLKDLCNTSPWPSNKSDLIPDDNDGEEEQFSYDAANQNLCAPRSSAFTNSAEVDKQDADIDSSDTLSEQNGEDSEKEQEESKESKDKPQENDIEKDFEALRDFAKKFSPKPKVEAKCIEDVKLEVREIIEEPIQQVSVNREQNVEDFHNRFALIERVQSGSVTLPDFSDFDSINFGAGEVDPDLLSMNLEDIPEETEEQLVQEEQDDGQNGIHWKQNWLFKGGFSPYQNVGDKQVTLNTGVPFHMMVPNPDKNLRARVGSRDVDTFSDSSGDLLSNSSDITDGSDDNGMGYYKDTSKELARISFPRQNGRHKEAGRNQKDRDKLLDRVRDSFTDKSSQDELEEENIDDLKTGPLIEPTVNEIKLLTDLVPAEGDDPKFVLAPESMTVEEGEPIKWSCRVGGTQPVDVFWYREGDEMEELESGEEAEITSSGDRHELTLYNQGRSSRRQYMCMAVNECGSATQYLVLTVKANKQELKKPEFLRTISDVEVTEGQSVKFRVKVKGYPQARINWYKDGVLLKSSRSCRLEKFGNRDYIMTLDSATMDDDAEYKVVARNVAGEVSCCAQVIVEPRSDQPPRRQQVTLYTSDSESDRGFVSRSRASPMQAAAPKTSSLSSLSTQYTPQEVFSPQLNHIDRKVSLTEKRVTEEKGRMQKDAAKNDGGLNLRLEPDEDGCKLLTPGAIELLQTAEEIIQHEQESSSHPKPPPRLSRTIAPVKNNVAPPTPSSSSSPLPLSIKQNNAITTDSSPSEKSIGLDILGDLNLPDTLEDFPLVQPTKSQKDKLQSDNSLGLWDALTPGPKAPEERFTSAVTFSSRSASPASSTGSQEPYVPNKAEVELKIDTNSRRTSDTEPNVIPQKDRLLLQSKFQPEPSPSVQRKVMLNNQYSRDFEIRNKQQDKKKWSVTIDPFMSAADVVNRNSQVTDTSDLSPSSSIRSPRSQMSSPRYSSDSGVSVTASEPRPAPVHMVGQTNEKDVPESRTEFNTDSGNFELPSVNRLKAMFGGGSSDSDDERGPKKFQVHSITARSVPKGKLEKLRSLGDENANIPSSPSRMSGSGGEIKASTASLKLNSALDSQWQNQKKQQQQKRQEQEEQLRRLRLQQQNDQLAKSGQPEHYVNVEGINDPILIYDQSQESYSLSSNEQSPLSNDYDQHDIESTPTPRGRTTSPPNHSPQRRSSTSPSKPPRAAQAKLVVRQAAKDEEDARPSGPRIKHGCTSARAAFWERKCTNDESVEDSEFPDMIEDGSS